MNAKEIEEGTQIPRGVTGRAVQFPVEAGASRRRKGVWGGGNVTPRRGDTVRIAVAIKKARTCCDDDVTQIELEGVVLDASRSSARIFAEPCVCLPWPYAAKWLIELEREDGAWAIRQMATPADVGPWPD